MVPADLMSARVVAVVVTWNRRELLAECLAALATQTIPLTATVVVDNASTDGTDELLRGHPACDVVSLRDNSGGAGGFAVGIERALDHRPELVWLLDDDTVPTPTAAEALVRAWACHDPGAPRPAVLASRVVWTDGRDHPMNTPRPSPFADAAARTAAEAVGAVPIRSASFVSIMCDADVVRERGLPVADYFLWNDDFEYSTRLIRNRLGLYVPASVVVHKTKVFGSTDADPGERFFFEVRNKIWLFRRSRSLAPREKLVYGGAAARRWLRTYQRSTDRRTLRSAGLRGLRAGLRKRPRPNPVVLGAAGWDPRPELTTTPVGFSLLMSTWAGDDPEQLREAYRSSVTDQTRPPSEVVLVQDGPVPEPLAAVLTELEHAPVPTTVVRIENNRGLGPALQVGLSACRFEVVARMDSDDISHPERFARQLPLIEAGADIVGAGLWEFADSIDNLVGRRTPPTSASQIRRVVRFRDPFNHPTVVYRRSAVEAAGGYPDLALLEDYLLFTRMVEGGAEPANLAEPLVYYRVDEGAYARRGGQGLLRSEIAMQRRLRDLGITSRWEFARNLAVRGGYRLVPEDVRKVAYRRLLANRSGGSGH